MDIFHGILVLICVGLFLSLKSKKNTFQLIKRKYCVIEYQLEGRQYEYIIPFNRLKAVESNRITGATSGKVYRFHPGLVPKINASLLGEAGFFINNNPEVVLELA